MDLEAHAQRFHDGAVALEDAVVLLAVQLAGVQALEYGGGVEEAHALAVGVGERTPHVIESLQIEAYALQVVAERFERPWWLGGQLPGAGHVERGAGLARLPHGETAAVGQTEPGVVLLVPVRGGQAEPVDPAPGDGALAVYELGAELHREAGELLVGVGSAAQALARFQQHDVEVVLQQGVAHGQTRHSGAQHYDVVDVGVVLGGCLVGGRAVSAWALRVGVGGHALASPQLAVARWPSSRRPAGAVRRRLSAFRGSCTRSTAQSPATHSG